MNINMSQSLADCDKLRWNHDQDFFLCHVLTTPQTQIATAVDLPTLDHTVPQYDAIWSPFFLKEVHALILVRTVWF